MTAPTTAPLTPTRRVPWYVPFMNTFLKPLIAAGVPMGFNGLLTVAGRTSGEPRTTPLIYEQAGDDYVIVASKGGAPEDPGWYRNLAKNPEVEVQVRDEVFPAHARVATGEERERLWELAAQQWPDYDSYKERTDREIPVIVLERES